MKALEFCQKNWQKPVGLCTAVILALSLLLAAFEMVDFEAFNRWQLSILGLAPLILIAVWFKTTRLPKAEKDSVGFAIAIRSENQAHAKKLKADFIKKLRELVNDWRPAGPVCFLDLGEGPVERLLENPVKQAQKLHDQTCCHFLIWGDAKERDIDGPKHILELEGSVTHGSSNPLVGATLAKEFRDLFPRRLQLAKEKDLFTFQFTAEWIDTVAQYIIGIAAFVSRDLDYSEALFLRLNVKLQQQGPSSLPQIAKIRTRLPSRIADVYKAKLSLLIHKHRLKRTRDLLVEMEETLSKLRKWESSYYSAHLASAMCHFLLRRDVDAASAELKKCEGVQDGTWLWSKAFLEVYLGNLDIAYRTYKKAFAARTDDPTVPIQSEEFINLVLEEEPGKGHLFFALGLINLRSKGDFNAARRDLSLFLDWANRTNAQVPLQVEAARKWISEIDDNELSTSQ